MSFEPDQYLQDALVRLSAGSIGEDALTDHFATVVSQTESLGSPELRKAKWENVIRRALFDLALTEKDHLDDAGNAYHQSLCQRLDIALVLTELGTDISGACDVPFVFNLLEELLDIHTVASCSHIFTWTEARAARLTKDLVPDKPKALSLLRAMNSLLSRLPKTGSSNAFRGRILIFLSSVFPLGERSGVNLRGEYGPQWESVVSEKPKSDSDQMDVDSTAKAADFFATFWSLQLAFSSPNTKFPLPQTMAEFKEAVGVVLPVISKANATEKAMMGSRKETGTSKLDSSSFDEDSAEASDYFFAKFLTSPDLLDLELADVYFRRQIILQLLILLHYLLTLTKAAKASWYTPRNRSLHIDFTLSDTDQTWVQDTIKTCARELNNTQPLGRLIAETSQIMLEREKNWIRWKAALCQPQFTKDRWLLEDENGNLTNWWDATKTARAKMYEPGAAWPHDMGTETLSDMWFGGYRGQVDTLEERHQILGPEKFANRLKAENLKVEKRLQIHRAAHQRKFPAKVETEGDDAVMNDENVPPPPFVPPQDDAIDRAEEVKRTINWQALREARDTPLRQHFLKLKPGDGVERLLEVKREAEQEILDAQTKTKQAVPEAENSIIEEGPTMTSTGNEDSPDNNTLQAQMPLEDVKMTSV